MDGVPATTDMHFRNGAVAFAYVSTLLMVFVDRHKVGLDDTIDRWMPTLPEADKVTLKMLANQTSGTPTMRLIRRGSQPSTQTRSASGSSKSGSPTRSPAPCSSLPGRTGATRTGPDLLGFGHKEASCEPTCFTQVNAYNFGLGVVRSGSWLLQNPLLGGYSATEAYLPSKRIAIAVAVTYLPGAFDSQGNYPNASDALFRSIGAAMAPNDPPPSMPG